MASLTKKTINGRSYYYLRECRWVNGKPKIVSQEYLGTTDDVVARLKAAPTLNKDRKKPSCRRPDLVLSAHVGRNDIVFEQLMKLHVPDGGTVADVTYGKGVFWRRVPTGRYRLLPTDIQSGTDLRKLPYADRSIDCVVLDPPYMAGLLNSGFSNNGTHTDFRDFYAARSTTNRRTKGLHGRFAHEHVLELYFAGAQEAYRVLKTSGRLVVKCQDEVKASAQFFTHVELINKLQTYGYVCKDLFVVVRNERPSVPVVERQHHARKNHSYFLVFRKKIRRRPLQARPAAWSKE